MVEMMFSMPPATQTLIVINVLVFFCAPAAASPPAREPSELVALVNAYRGAAQTCEGQRVPGAGPLAPDANLAAVKPDAGRPLQDALKARGYPAAQAQAIILSGPASASAAMDMMKQRYCAPLLSARFTNIGVSRDGRTWRVVLARPLLAGELGESHQAGAEVLRLTNAARAKPRTCGERQLGAAPPLRWANELGAAALVHSRDMAQRNYFDHRGSDGSDVGDRAKRAGYPWRRVGENVAAGQGSATQAVSAWLSSPSHCANLMNRDFAEMGAAYALNTGSDSVIYWTQVFGTRR
jgi:uncharacterized protein YkwD